MAVMKIKKNGVWIPVGVGEKGEQGVQGQQGVRGETGTGISSISANGNTTIAGDYTRNEYEVKYTDGTKSNIYINARNGEKGRSVSNIYYYKLPEQTDASSTQYQMVFEDSTGTPISTPTLAVPKGDKGDKGDVGATFSYDSNTLTITT